VPELLEQLRNFYQGLEPGRRRALIAAAIASFAVIVGVGLWASRTEYIVLARASNTDEAGEITRALGRGGVPYKLDTDGLTVLVPAPQEVEARRTAAAEGVFVGLEGLSSIPAFVTPGQEQLYAKRMIQGELVRMINALQGVAASDVQISLPERNAYLRQQERATASVTLHPDPGQMIDPGAARSVAQLVAHAVADMTPQDVTVVDASTMRILWGDGASGAAASDTEFTNLAASRESALAAAVRGALGQVLGSPDASSVTVRVELETAETQTTTKSIDPDSVVPAEERLETESDARATAAAAGVPGTDANIPERAGTGAAGTTGRKRELQSTTYEFGSSVSTTTKPAGDIRRLSATVIVDAAAFAKVAEGRDAAEVRKAFDAAIRGALGASDKRGDTVVFDVLPFTPVAAPEELELMATTSVWASVLPSLVAALAVVLGFIFFVRPLMRLLRVDPQSQEVVLAGGTEKGGGPGSAESEIENAADLAERIRARVANLRSHAPADVSALVEKESEHSAEVLRRWIRH
jgi:flagellar M-ring protein FliF